VTVLAVGANHPGTRVETLAVEIAAHPVPVWSASCWKVGQSPGQGAVRAAFGPLRPFVGPDAVASACGADPMAKAAPALRAHNFTRRVARFDK
jgi:hypothetical protein